MVFYLLLLLCSPRCRTVWFVTHIKKDTFAILQSHSNIVTVLRKILSHVPVRLQNDVGYKRGEQRRTEKKKQIKHHQLAQLIKLINTLAILFVVILELTKFRTMTCLELGHLHIVRMPLLKYHIQEFK